MRFSHFKPLIAGVLLLVSAQSAISFEREIDEKAVVVLNAMEAHIGGLTTVEVVSESSAEINLGTGLLAEQARVSHLWIKRPGLLRISLDGDQGAREMYIKDGALSIYNTDRQFYAEASIPKDVDAAVDYAVDELELDFPFFDLIHNNAAENLLSDMHTVLHLGRTRVRGVECDHVVLRNLELDVQLFIASGDAPEPIKVVFTSKWEAGMPRHTAFLSWKISPRIEDSLFEFTPPDGATKIRFINAVQEAR